MLEVIRFQVTDATHHHGSPRCNTPPEDRFYIKTPAQGKAEEKEAQRKAAIKSLMKEFNIDEDQARHELSRWS